MNDKRLRQDAILQILGSERIGSQEELSAALRKRGIPSTQATLSRDLRSLKVVKQQDADGYPSYQVSRPPRRLPAGHLEDGVDRIEFAGGLGVVKVAPGYAPMTAARIDAEDVPSLMGTIAGDDTLLLILREGFSRTDVLRDLERVLPGLSDRETLR